MTATHTPGPWRVVHQMDGAVHVDGLTCVADLGDAGATREANARLIAAAPDLLAALQALDAAAFTEDRRGVLMALPVTHPAWATASAAIAKATGE